jgi:glycosyltransferase involved in cell wall biosynthesis
MLLATLLDSILEQSEQRWECVIIDDGSTDNTAIIAEHYAALDDRFSLFLKPNGGASSARNFGFRHSSTSSRYVTFMDSDDVWMPDALQLLLAAAESDRSSIGSHGLADFIDSDGLALDPGAYAERGRERYGVEGRRLVRWPVDRPTDFRVLINGNVLFPPGLVLIRREAYEEVGPFDESFKGAEDWDMLIRLSRLGYITFVDQVILLYRRHDHNLGAAPGIPAAAWRVRCKAFHSSENTPTQRDIAKRGWRAYQREMIATRLREIPRLVRNRTYLAAGRDLARVPLHIGRYVRGHPTPRIKPLPLAW